jgi:hypothetical protein
VIVSLYFGKISTFNESGKISIEKKNGKELTSRDDKKLYPLIFPRISSSLVILNKRKLIFSFSSKFFFLILCVNIKFGESQVQTLIGG